MIVAVLTPVVFTDYDTVSETLSGLSICKIISGGDKLSAWYAAEHELPIEILRPKWSLGRDARLLRNSDIAADMLVVFYDGKTASVRDAIHKAIARGIPITMVQVPR
jgi:hypothetical protein